MVGAVRIDMKTHLHALEKLPRGFMTLLHKSTETKKRKRRETGGKKQTELEFLFSSGRGCAGHTHRHTPTHVVGAPLFAYSKRLDNWLLNWMKLFVRLTAQGLVLKLQISLR